MASALITNIHHMDPVLPERLPQSIIDKADTLPSKAAYLDGLLAPETAAQLAKLLQITNTFYSNMIEGQYTELAEMQHAQTVPRRERQVLQDLAVKHMGVQLLFERAIRMASTPFEDMFDPRLLCTVHARLFTGTSGEKLRLGNGRELEPGQLRSRPDEEVVIGSHAAPAARSVPAMLAHLQTAFGRNRDTRRKLLSALAYHHRLAWVHPFMDGNGRVTRMVTHLQLFQLGLKPHLWSLSRGLARRHAEYYRVLAMADKPREGDLDGRGQMSEKHYFAFLEFMLDVCHDQIDYMTAALNRTRMYGRLIRSFKNSELILDKRIRPESGPAVAALLLQGKMLRSDFKTFTGLSERPATDELSRLIKAGIVVSPTPKSKTIEPGLPAWFAAEIFPELHRRFQ